MPKQPQHYDVKTADGLNLTLTRKVAPDQNGRPPIIMVHGAGVRSQIFNPPRTHGLNLDDALVQAGFDVWNFDWRASIEQAPNQWTLDRAAVHDFPAAIAKIIEVSGASEVQAMVHCQGSTSFMMSLVSGLLPQVSNVVSNAVSLHPIVPTLARLKALYAVPSLGRFFPYLNPQWGISAPAGWPKVFDFYVRAVHHECNNPVCKWSSFTFGSGFPTLWRHENLDDATHDWLTGEFAHVPMSFFRQIGKSIKAGHLTTTGEFSKLGESVVAQPPKTDARVVFLAGELNDCFYPESQMRSYDYMERFAPGRHSFHQLPGYGHLDVFVGKNSARDIFPIIIDEFSRG
ncbi:MAG: alpha/beta hydrolase [Planktomarina sp.]